MAAWGVILYRSKHDHNLVYKGERGAAATPTGNVMVVLPLSIPYQRAPPSQRRLLNTRQVNPEPLLSLDPLRAELVVGAEARGMGGLGHGVRGRSLLEGVDTLAGGGVEVVH